METPPNLVTWLVIAGAVTILACLSALLYWAERAMRMCDRLLDTIRAMGLAASSPLAAARLEQQRLRQQTTADKPRDAMLAEIAAHQGAKVHERQAQNRAAHPTPGKPTTWRYVSPDDDLLPRKEDVSPDKPSKDSPTPPGASQ